MEFGITPFDSDHGNLVALKDEKDDKNFDALNEASKNITGEDHDDDTGEYNDNDDGVMPDTQITDEAFLKEPEMLCPVETEDNVSSDVIGFEEVEKIRNDGLVVPVKKEDIILPSADFIDDDSCFRTVKRNRIKDAVSDGETYHTLKNKPLENEVYIEKHKTFIRLPDFRKIDEEYRATFKKEKLQFARSFGYTTISGAIYDLYYNKGGSLESVGAMLGYEHFSVGIFIRKMGWPTREAGGLQSSKISRRLVAEIRRDFIVKTQWIKSNFARYYKKKAEQLNVDIETIRRIVYNSTFYDENYEVYAEKIRKIAKEKTNQQLIKQKQAIRYEANRVRFKD